MVLLPRLTYERCILSVEAKTSAGCMAVFEAGWGGVVTLRGSIRSRYVALGSSHTSIIPSRELDGAAARR